MAINYTTLYISRFGGWDSVGELTDNGRNVIDVLTQTDKKMLRKIKQ